MSFEVKSRLLTKKNEPEFRRIWETSFPRENWAASIGHKKDKFIAAHDSERRIIGFCQVHCESPYALTTGPGAWMYNLCVDPKWRRQGVASAILREVASMYPRVYAHVDYEHPGSSPEFMTRNGWTKLDVWRQKFIEFGVGAGITPPAQDTAVAVEQRSRHYDPENNVVYLTPVC